MTNLCMIHMLWNSLFSKTNVGSYRVQRRCRNDEFIYGSSVVKFVISKNECRCSKALTLKQRKNLQAQALFEEYRFVLPTHMQLAIWAYVAMLCNSGAQRSWRSKVIFHVQARWFNAVYMHALQQCIAQEWLTEWLIQCMLLTRCLQPCSVAVALKTICNASSLRWSDDSHAL